MRVGRELPDEVSADQAGGAGGEGDHGVISRRE